MLRLDDTVPDFEALTTQGSSFRLSAHRGRPVVIFFYPKAFTPGCTREARGFAESFDEFRALGAELVGISEDTHATQCAFAEELKVPFPLIADADGAVARQFDVLWRFFPKAARRMTFLIDGAGKLRGVFSHELLIGRHVDDALRALRKLQGVTSTSAAVPAR